MTQRNKHHTFKADVIPCQETSDPAVLSKTPLVSAEMITYNHELYIAQAIEGVLMQKTDFPIELIIGEDCSTDRTRKIVLDYQKKYPDIIRVITSDRNVGAGKNSERTHNACRGKYIAFCEGDDYWIDPYKLQKQVDFLEANPEYAMCSHAVKTIFVGGIKEEDRFVKPLRTATFDDILGYHFLPTLSLVFRKELINNYPSWYLNVMSGDIAIELMLAHYGKIYYMDDVMGVKRVHPGGITQTLHKRQSKKSVLENKLYMYKSLNKHFHYEHNTSLSKVIVGILLALAKIELKEKNFFCSIVVCFQALYTNPKLFLGKIFSFLSRYK